MRTLVTAALVILLSACAGPILEKPSVSESDLIHARQALATHGVKPSLYPLTHSEMHRILGRAWARARPAVHRVCNRVLTDCNRIIGQMRVVLVPNPSVNAYADARTMTIGVHQGFLQAMGSDEELIAVLGHEAAHLLLGHTKHKTRNSGVGALVGLLAGAAAGAALHDSGADQQFVIDLAADSMAAGAYLGSLAYAPEMEMEADQFAMHVLAELGIRLNAGLDMIVRLRRGSVPGAVRQGEGWAGFLSTHPPHDHRLAAMHATVRYIRSGGRLRRSE